jgi:hypothetical protein
VTCEAADDALVPRQVLCAIVGADERTYPNLTLVQLAWLADTHLMQGLLEQVGPGAAADAQKNAAGVLTAIARSQLAGPLARAFVSPDFCEQLLRCAFLPRVSVQVCARCRQDCLEVCCMRACPHGLLACL